MTEIAITESLTTISISGETESLITVGGDDVASLTIEDMNSWTFPAGSIVINEGGAGDVDFRVETDTEENMLFVDANGSSDGLVYIGGTTNGIKVEKGGNLTLLGTATHWDDFRVAVTATKLGGTKDPGFEKVLDNGAGSQGVFTYYFDKAIEEELYFPIQMPHNWNGGAIYPHVHWFPKTADSDGLQTIRWGLEYTWQNIGGVFGNSSIVYGNSTGGHDAALVHTLTSLSTITPSSDQNGLSSMMICRLFRDATSSDDTYDYDAGLLEFDLHYAIDSFGSQEELVK